MRSRIVERLDATVLTEGVDCTAGIESILSQVIEALEEGEILSWND
jgi:hypothetical protein